MVPRECLASEQIVVCSYEWESFGILPSRECGKTVFDLNFMSIRAANK